MKKLVRLLIPLMVLAGSCAPVKYLVDYDTQTDFRTCRYYNFTPASDSIPLDQARKRELFNAISRVMNENHIRWDARPEIYVHIHMLPGGGTPARAIYLPGETVSLNSGSSGYMDPGEYSEGSLFIAIIDIGRKQLVWTGIASGRTRDIHPLDEQDIQVIVQRLFRDFPPTPPGDWIR